MASYLDTISERAVRTSTTAKQRSTALLDRVVAPQQRDELVRHVSSWANRNPRVALFVALHLLTLGPPLILFTLFCGATLLTALSLTLLFALGVSFALLATVGIFILAPALIIGSAAALSLFVAVTLSTLIVQRVRPRTASATPIASPRSPIKYPAAPTAAYIPTPGPTSPTPRDTYAAPESMANGTLPQPNGNASAVRPDLPTRTTSEQKAHERELLTRQALGIPAGVSLDTTPDAAVAAAAERQRVVGTGEGRTPEPERRMQLEEQIRLGEEIARRAMEGKMGIVS